MPNILRKLYFSVYKWNKFPEFLLNISRLIKTKGKIQNKMSAPIGPKSHIKYCPSSIHTLFIYKSCIDNSSKTWQKSSYFHVCRKSSYEMTTRTNNVFWLLIINEVLPLWNWSEPFMLGQRYLVCNCNKISL